MTAQKKEVPNKTEQKHPHADNNGWIEVKRTRDNNKSSPKGEHAKSKTAVGKNQFDTIKNPKAEKGPKQKVAQKVPQLKSKSASPPKQKTAHAKATKTEEAPKNKKIEAKIMPAKSKPVQVSAKFDKPIQVSTKIDKSVKTAPPKTIKATQQKDKKTDVKGGKKSSLGGFCKQLLHWFGIALFVVSVIGAISVGYQQHKSILDNAISLHKQDMHDLKMQFGKEVIRHQEVAAEKDKLMKDLQEKMKSLNNMDSTNAEKFRNKLDKMEKQYKAELEPLLKKEKELEDLKIKFSKLGKKAT